jgi:hypothetical protein
LQGVRWSGWSNFCVYQGKLDHDGLERVQDGVQTGTQRHGMIHEVTGQGDVVDGRRDHCQIAILEGGFEICE